MTDRQLLNSLGNLRRLLARETLKTSSDFVRIEVARIHVEALLNVLNPPPPPATETTDADQKVRA